MKKQPFFQCDFERHFAALSDEQAGKIIKAIFAYQNNLSQTYFDDRFLDAYFQLTLEKIQKQAMLFDKRKFTSAQNGQKGGRPRAVCEKPKKPNSALLRLRLIQQEIANREKIKNLFFK